MHFDADQRLLLIVRDKNGQALAYFYFEEEPGQRETAPDIAGYAAANSLTGKSDEVIREALGNKFQSTSTTRLSVSARSLLTRSATSG